MLRDVDVMACLGNLFQQWIVSGKEGMLVYVSSTGMFQVMKRSSRCSCGGFVVIHRKSNNTVDGS